LKRGGAPSSRKGSADHCDAGQHKHYGYTDVRRSEEDACGDALNYAAATSKMIGNEHTFAVTRHEGVDRAKDKGDCDQRWKAVHAGGRLQAFRHAAVKPALRGNQPIHVGNPEL
jgi:hypothetical protein